MEQGAMLNIYPDSLGGDLSHFVRHLRHPAMDQAFQSVYILPSLFHSDLDRGFSVISYDLNRTLASPEDLDALREMRKQLKLDFVLNHASVLSPQFQDLLKNGEKSEWKDFFIQWNSFWQGCGSMTEAGYIQPDPAYLEPMFFRKPGLPLLMVPDPDGRLVPYWNTFYQHVSYPSLDAQDLMSVLPLQYAQARELAQAVNSQLEAGEEVRLLRLGEYEAFRTELEKMLYRGGRYLGQMDLNVRSEKVWQYYRDTVAKLAGYGAKLIRLDAFAYTSKEPGKRNFLNEPETWDILARVRALAEPHGAEVLPEIHATYASGCYAQLAARGYRTYDFFLPGLVLDALENHSGDLLASWINELAEKEIKTVNMLGCHDGIPLLDLQGLMPRERIEALIALVVSRGGLIKNLHGKKDTYYQVNATYYSALGESDQKLLAARALQLFTPGIPQIWYLDLFAGRNDLDAVAHSGAAGHKEINRTNLTDDQVEAALQKEVVQRQLRLIALRTRHPAFRQGARVRACTEGARIMVEWVNQGDKAVLDLRLDTASLTVAVTDGAGNTTYMD